MTNSVRGEIEVDIDGQPFKLALTLGALAEIEEALGVESINELGPALTTISARRMQSVFLALARAGGQEVTKEQIAAFPLAVLNKVILAINQAFAAANTGTDEAGDGEAADAEGN